MPDEILGRFEVSVDSAGKVHFRALDDLEETDVANMRQKIEGAPEVDVELKPPGVPCQIIVLRCMGTGGSS